VNFHAGLATWTFVSLGGGSFDVGATNRIVDVVLNTQRATGSGDAQAGVVAVSRQGAQGILDNVITNVLGSVRSQGSDLARSQQVAIRVDVLSHDIHGLNFVGVDQAQGAHPAVGGSGLASVDVVADVDLNTVGGQGVHRGGANRVSQFLRCRSLGQAAGSQLEGAAGDQVGAVDVVANIRGTVGGGGTVPVSFFHRVVDGGRVAGGVEGRSIASTSQGGGTGCIGVEANRGANSKLAGDGEVQVGTVDDAIASATGAGNAVLNGVEGAAFYVIQLTSILDDDLADVQMQLVCIGNIGRGLRTVGFNGQQLAHAGLQNVNFRQFVIGGDGVVVSSRGHGADIQGDVGGQNRRGDDGARVVGVNFNTRGVGHLDGDRDLRLRANAGGGHRGGQGGFRASHDQSRGGTVSNCACRSGIGCRPVTEGNGRVGRVGDVILVGNKGEGDGGAVVGNYGSAGIRQLIRRARVTQHGAIVCNGSSIPRAAGQGQGDREGVRVGGTAGNRTAEVIGNQRSGQAGRATECFCGEDFVGGLDDAGVSRSYHAAQSRCHQGNDQFLFHAFVSFKSRYYNIVSKLRGMLPALLLHMTKHSKA